MDCGLDDVTNVKFPDFDVVLWSRKRMNVLILRKHTEACRGK